MKVIFIEDVPDVALAGETKVVADGYGRNFLLPKKLAVLANSAASNVVEVQLKRVAVKRAQAATEMGELAKKLEGTEINLKARAGEKDRLYGSITAADIAQALSQSAGQEIDKRKIVLEEPIRQVGTHDVTVRFTHDIEAVIRVTVEAEAPLNGEALQPTQPLLKSCGVSIVNSKSVSVFLAKTSMSRGLVI